MKRKTKKIIAKEWLTFLVICVSFPLVRFIMIFVRAFQAKRAKVDLPDITNIEAVLFLLLFYVVYLLVRSIVWSIMVLREN